MGKGKITKEVKSNITDNESAKMTTSKGTMQGYNGVATVDKKHQIVVDAQAFGEGQEHHTLQPVLESIAERYNRLGISNDIYKASVVITADTGFANEANMKYLHENEINGYIPDNQFRSRDPKFSDQKSKYGQRHQNKKKKTKMIPAREFTFDVGKLTCIFPVGEKLSLRTTMKDKQGNEKAFFEGRLSQCRHCLLKHECLHNPPHPGEIIKELCLEPLGLTITEAANALGVSRKTVSSIINGKAGISPEMAVRLSIAFNTSSESWMNQQSQYDLWQAEQHRSELHVIPLSAA